MPYFWKAKVVTPRVLMFLCSIAGNCSIVQKYSPKSALLMYSLVITWLIGSILLPVSLNAQSSNPIPLSESNAFDPNCYIPNVGTDIDSIYGTRGNNALGENILNLGPTQDQTGSRVIIKNIPDNLPNHSIFNIGPGFNIHSLRSGGQKTSFQNHFTVKGHFRSPKYVDLFDAESRTIYWSDEEGNYSDNNKTFLSSATKGDNGYSPLENPIVGHFTSDSLDDIMFQLTTDWKDFDSHKDSVYVLLYRGGEGFYSKGAVAHEDEVATIGHRRVEKGLRLGDFRGTGRMDVLAGDREHNLFLYKNDKPFSLSKLVNAIQYDTLLAVWQNPHITGWSAAFAMRAMAKPDWDKSQDLLLGLNTDDDRNGSIGFLQTGPDFGSKRITLDDVSYIIHSPYYYDPRFTNMFFPGTLMDCGDMTGTGNRVLLIATGTGGPLSDLYLFFYVTGKALDSKVDMCYVMTRHPGFAADTITANTDNLQDMLLGFPGYESDKDNSKDRHYVGTIHLLKGSKKIPVRLNPLFSVKELALDSKKLSVYPNPCKSSVTVSYDFENNDAKQVEAKLYDMLGRIVYQTSWIKLKSMESYSLTLPALKPGIYTLRLLSDTEQLSVKLTVVR